MSAVISVVVPTFRRQDRLGLLLQRLSGLENSDALEVIIVDQTPGESEPDFSSVDQFTHEVRYIRLTHPNVAAARNYGAKLASGSLILFMDDDISLDRSFLLTLRELAVNPLDVFAPFLSEDEYEPQAESGNALFLPTGVVAIHRDAFLASRGFDENLYRFGEDAEWSHRLKAQGFKLFRTRKLKATHHHVPQNGTWYSVNAAERAAQLMNCQLYFVRKVEGAGFGTLLIRGLRATLHRSRNLQPNTPRWLNFLSLVKALPGALAYAFRSPRLLSGT